MIVKLLTEHHLEFRSLKGGCRGSSVSTVVKISNCWKSHAAALYMSVIFFQLQKDRICIKYLSFTYRIQNIIDASSYFNDNWCIRQNGKGTEELKSFKL